MYPRLHRRRFKVSDALVVLFLTSSILLAVVLYNMSISDRDSSEKDDTSDLLKSLPQTLVRVAYYLNKTTGNIDSIDKTGKTKSTVLYPEIEGVYEKLEITRTELKYTDSPLSKKLINTVNQYIGLAKASMYLYNASEIYSSIKSSLKNALEDIEYCRIDEGVQEYLGVRDKLLDLIGYINSTIGELEQINSTHLVSQDHVNILNRSLNVSKRIQEELLEYYRFMEKVVAYKEVLKKMCRIIHGSGESISGEELNTLSNFVGSVDTGKMGSFGSSAGNIVTTIKSFIEQYGEEMDTEGSGGGNHGSGMEVNNTSGNSGIGPSNEEGAGGSGAGYREVSEDD